MRESIHAIHCDFLSPQSEWIRSRKPSVIMHIGFFTLFSRHISGTQSFLENQPFIFQARVVLKPLVSLIGRLVACSDRISVDTQTDKPTTVTLAAHARRGLTKGRRCETLGTLQTAHQVSEEPAVQRGSCTDVCRPSPENHTALATSSPQRTSQLPSVL